MINRGGEKIPVAEVEQLLGDHPAIADVAIVAMPDARLGERACAFVVLRRARELDFDQMQHYLDACQVAKQYWPERLEIVAELAAHAVGQGAEVRAARARQELAPARARQGKIS